MKRKAPRIIISATSKSSGKTTVSLGLCAALAERGLNVQPFKKGPDYIDPMWLSAAAGKPCHNLDHYMFDDKIEEVFEKHAPESGLSLIEGNKGLFDSVDVEGVGSTERLAERLDAPVILVMDAGKITRGIVPILLGYQQFGKNITIAGIILNKVANPRHEGKLRALMEEYTDIPLLGCIRRDAEVEITERHLGLIPVNEHYGLYPKIEPIKRMIEKSIDLDKVMSIAEGASKISCQPRKYEAPVKSDVRIGIFNDQAFSFYYQENIDMLKKAGAELVPVNALRDRHLPKVDGLYIGGGFPEALMEKLEMNVTLRRDIKEAIENNMPVHAECGGLMFLAKTVAWQGKISTMVGALDCDIVVEKKPQGHGYINVKPTGKSPWIQGEQVIKAHEFHYARVANWKGTDFAYEVVRGTGITGEHDGIIYKNVTAAFTHIHSLGFPEWAGSFVSFVRKESKKKQMKESYVSAETKAA